ncbi:hypothetical protein QTV49_004592 [Vibrio vulnificus]|nr:hypothetical protein [Vibrio vulnificus]
MNIRKSYASIVLLALSAPAFAGDTGNVYKDGEGYFLDTKDIKRGTNGASDGSTLVFGTNSNTLKLSFDPFGEAMEACNAKPNYVRNHTSDCGDYYSGTVYYRSTTDYFWDSTMSSCESKTTTVQTGRDCRRDR